MPETEIQRKFDDASACADELINRLSGRVSLALPLGLGKAFHLVNALYQRARVNPDITLHVHSALSLEIPKPGSDLEARFLDPMVERLYAGVPELDYLADLRRGTLPGNVRLQEFYFRPGSFLGVPDAQQNYVSTNYTHAARDLAARGINVIAQMIVPDASGAAFSLGCNPDLTQDLLNAARARGAAPLLIGEVNRQLPFMHHDAVVADAEFDLILDASGTGYPLFPVPNQPVSLTEHAIALRVASLIKDGGTLQSGIGSLSDAIAAALIRRREHNDLYRSLVNTLGVESVSSCLDELTEGLYAASEMFVEGFLHLRDSGVLCRTTADGVYLEAGFFLGSAQFYERLRGLNDVERRGINMTHISFTNTLFGDEAGKRAQRSDARFVNSAMMVTLTGAVVSDGLEDGRVVSGVGGQYNFVAMAHELADARSIIAVPATRRSNTGVSSNIVWSYGHVTIPRHLRDMVVTEYGVADLRGHSDNQVITALLNITDSRFQDTLRNQAVAAGKLSPEHQIPERYRNNLPSALNQALAENGHLAALPFYPFGTDLTEVESELAIALSALKEHLGERRSLLRTAWRGQQRIHDPNLAASLERMGLNQPRGIKEMFYRALLAGALAEHLHDTHRPLNDSHVGRRRA